MDTEKQIREIDFHLLDLRYSHTRIKNDKALARMQNSVHIYGQIVPALAVPAAGQFVLIDGYLRLSALKSCGSDCIKVLLMDEEPDSLLTLLAKSDDRQLETVEQATLIQELHNRFSYSFTEIAKRLGKNKSWVKRRLDILESLPEEVLVAVMNGTVSSWAASRILVPLSRANEQDCIDLTRKIVADPLSTRELVSLYDHYKTSNRTVRDRIVANPSLFSKTTKQLEEQKLGQQINEGPEGKWFKDISIVCHILKRLKKTVDSVLYPALDSHHKNRCQIWLSCAEKIIAELQEQTKRENHDNSGIPTDHS